VGKHPQMVNPSKSNPGFGQKLTFSKSQEKVPTNKAKIRPKPDFPQKIKKGPKLNIEVSGGVN